MSLTTDNNDQGPRVLAFNPANEYYSDELCYINELSNSALDTEVSIARARVAPGITTRWHRLQGTTERYCILEGRAMVEVGDQEPQQLLPGDVVLIMSNGSFGGLHGRLLERLEKQAT